MTPIRVLLADDHKLMRSGLRLLLQQSPELTEVGEADDGREAGEVRKCMQTDVVGRDGGRHGGKGGEAGAQMGW